MVYLKNETIPIDVILKKLCDTDEKKKIIKVLYELDQSHLFKKWFEFDTSSEYNVLPSRSQIDEFFYQVENLNKSYPGGICGYIHSAQKLLKQSADGVNPFDGWAPCIPNGMSLAFGDKKYLEMEKIGMDELHSVCFVLVAGGLGERLGYSGIKVALPVETITNTCYLSFYIQQILVLQSKARKRIVEKKEIMLPLVIMVSGDTEEKTKKLLKENNNFGLDKKQLHILRQEKVASFIDNAAHLALDENPGSGYKILTKPHGHGDVHMLLHQSGLVKKWKEEGRKWVMFFQDTNALVFNDVIPLLGASASQNLHVNSVAIRRKAKDAAGGLVKLVKSNGESMTINVEYNQLDPLLRSTINPLGDVNESDGYSCFPGNINQIVIAIDPYEYNLMKTGGVMGEFVNPKYADDTRTEFKSPARLECMMQDYPKSICANDNDTYSIGFTLFESWLVYSPCKNNVKEALMKANANIPAACASVAEHEFYLAQRLKLSALGINISSSMETHHKWYGIPVSLGAQVILYPSFATSCLELKSRFITPQNVTITEKSTLVIDAANIKIHSLYLDGALTIKAVVDAHIIIQELHVVNEGWKYTSVEEDQTISEVLRIRGYRLEKVEQYDLEFNQSGRYIITGNQVEKLE